MHKFIRLLLVFIALVFSISLIIIAVYFSTIPYSDFIFNIAHLLQKEHWINFFENAFPQKNYVILGHIIWLLCVVWVGISYFMIRNRIFISDLLIRYIKLLFEELYQLIRSLISQSLPDKIFIFSLTGIISIRALYLIIVTPLQYDEMWTYNYFISGSIWKSLLLPGNNHIFFTWVASIFTALPVEADIAIRLPSLIAGVLVILIFWIFVRSRYNMFVAMTGTAFFATSILVSMYIVYARSYMFVLFFFLVMFWSSIKIAEEKRNISFDIIFFGSMILGYLSNPVFLYGHLSVMITLLMIKYFFKRESEFFRLFKLSLIGALFLLVIYLPVLLTSHAGNLIAYGWKNEVDKPFEFAKQTFYSLSRNQLGFDYAYLIYPLIYIAALVLAGRNIYFRNLALQGIIAFLVTLFFSFLQKKVLSGHLTIFITFHTSICFMICVSYFTMNHNNWRNWFVFPLSLIFIFNSLITYTDKFFFWSRDKDTSCKYFSEILMKNNISECFLQQFYFKPGFEYYFKKEGRNIKIHMFDKQSQDYLPFDYDASYQSVIVDKTSHIFSPGDHYRLIYSDNYAELWVPK